MMKSQNNWFVRAIIWCTAFVFLGRAYQFLFFDAPIRALLWDENLMKPLVEGVFNTDWSAYVGSSTVDTYIQLAIRSTGWLFLLAAVAALTITRSRFKINRILLAIGGAALVILSFLYMKEKFYHYGQFFEHSIQFGLPFLLLYISSRSFRPDRLLLTLKVMVALTFTAHGLYAIGYYPVPGNFIDMTIASLGVTESTARVYLTIAGILDILLAIALFIPKLAKYALAYAAIWGLLTAFARITGTVHVNMLGLTLHQAVYQVIYRLPHGLIPLITLFMLIKAPALSKPTNSKILSSSES